MLLKTTLTFTLALSAIALTSCSDDRRGDGNVVFVGCGDGNQQSTEECDDGNRTNGDGCSAACTIENNNATCGNGAVETGEQCDDGNTTGGDGCSAACQLENTANCGNGTIDAGEQCDDGNTTGGDGCSATCQTEGGAVCGNGTVEAGETCDDGNTTSGDGCSSTCQTEGGAVCGNGLVEAGETCDDGNTTSGDGCSSTCQTEGMAVCGNGLVEAGETCDDGNTVNGDGCDSECQTEMMGVTCQQACNHVFTCTEMECPGTYNEQACVDACLMDPVGFMPEAVAALSCAEINAQICVQMQETNSGAACMMDGDCMAGTLQPFCILPTDMNGQPSGWEGGYCTAIGCNGDAACGTNKVCVTIDQMGTRACFQGCTPANNGAGVCRMSYQCLDVSGGQGVGVCFPNCTDNADCNTGQTCNTATGQCM